MNYWKIIVAVALCFSQLTWVGADVCENKIDTQLRGFDFNIVELSENGEYRAYFESGNIVTAVSDNGIDWEVEGEVTGLPPTSEETVISNPWVFITDDGRFRMIYEAFDPTGNRRFYSAISNNGIDFSREGAVLSGDNYYYDTYPNSTITNISSPDGIKIAGGHAMVFTGGDSLVQLIVSSYGDGLYWDYWGRSILIQKAANPSLVRLPGSGYGIFYNDVSTNQRGKAISLATLSNTQFIYGLSDHVYFKSQAVVESTLNNELVIDPEAVVTPDERVRLYYSRIDPETKESAIYTCLVSQDYTDNPNVLKLTAEGFNQSQSILLPYVVLKGIEVERPLWLKLERIRPEASFLYPIVESFDPLSFRVVEFGEVDEETAQRYQGFEPAQINIGWSWETMHLWLPTVVFEDQDIWVDLAYMPEYAFSGEIVFRLYSSGINDLLSSSRYSYYYYY